MRRFLKIATSILAITASIGAASASDNEKYKWGGAYIGAGIGAASLVAEHANSDNRVDYFRSVTSGGQGVLGTVVAGYDYKLTSSIVGGVFADFDFGGAEAEWIDTQNGNRVYGQFKQKSAFGLGGRLGILASPSTLLYLNGGWTSAKFDEINFEFTNGVSANRQIPSQSVRGGFIGGGLETKVTQSASLRLEYRYSNFGEKVLDRINPTTGAFSTQVREDITTQSVRAAIVYKFGQ